MFSHITKYLPLLLIISCCKENAICQTNAVSLIVITDTITAPIYNGTRINIFQNNKLIRSRFFEKILVVKGKPLEIEFENNTIQIPGIKGLVFFSDTTVSIIPKTLQEVLVKNKKKIIGETLKGFDYYPQNDNVYKDKPLILALQRLPFIKVDNENSRPAYKNDLKILFTINGKQRNGIENGWVDVLKSIKAKDIYKVELIEEIPVTIKNQGYYAIINIMTLDENIYGIAFNAALIYDQRKNLNKNIGFTALRKKTDLSIRVRQNEDIQKGGLSTEIYNSNKLILDNNTSTRYMYKGVTVNTDYGYRINSFNDIGLNLTFATGGNTTAYANTYSFPLPLADTKRKIEINTFSTNISYVNRKIKNVIKSLSLAVNVNQEVLGNRTGYLTKKAYDSLNNEIKTSPLEFIAEYNIQNNQNSTLSKEYGIQVYNKNSYQHFYMYNLNQQTNENNQLLYENTDTFFNKQLSMRPYCRVNKNITTKKGVGFIFSTEVFSFTNSGVSTRTFFLPEIRVRYKKIANGSTSFRHVLSIAFSKPNIDYWSPVGVVNNPIQKTVGNTLLQPAKFVSYEIEVVRRKKSNISNSIKIYYAFDNFNFFNEYDQVSNTLIQSTNNGGIAYSIGNSFGYWAQLSKKISLSFNANINYSIRENKIFNTKYSGFTFYGGHTINYDISSKLGSISFLSFLNGNQNGEQGYFQGTVKYLISYGRSFAHKRLAIGITTENFLLKNRKVLTYTFTDTFKQYSTVTIPYRNISIRVAYNFSNIKVEKYATKRTTEISGEAQRIN